MSPADLLLDHLGHHITGVDVDGADGHHLLSVPWSQLTNQHGDEGVELGHLFPEGVLQGVVVALLQLREGHVHVKAPPDLSARECHLQ